MNVERFSAIVGAANAITDPAGMAPYMHEWRDRWHGTSPLVLRPGSTAEVAAIMSLAHETGTAIVPQSGNTGLVGGGVARGEVLLSLDRMTRILEVDADGFSMTVEAGVTLASVQAAAEAVGRQFPLSLASEGSCRIGGNLATNAGGVNVLAYGSARDLCLGLEVVLADGRVWNGLRKLRKDNTGYDLRNIFIGSEGTLGVITAAVLKLVALPKRHETALVAVPSPDAAVALLGMLKGAGGSGLVACELIPSIGLDMVCRHMGGRVPLAAASPWSVLAEFADPAESLMERCMEDAIAAGIAADAVIAQSLQQRQTFWALRENISEAQKFEGASIKHDVAVPVSRVPAFITAAMAAIEKIVHGCRPVCFGHLGDGNMHFNVSQPVGMEKAAFMAREPDLNEAVYDIVLREGGTISAEHGIGVLKREWMHRIKSPVELQMMRDLKQMLDPKNILNPGKVLP